MVADFILAKALWEAPANGGRDRRRARKLVRDAIADPGRLRGAQRDSLAEARAWLQTHRSL